MVVVRGKEGMVGMHTEPDLRQPSDHAPLLVDLPISPENICFSRKVLKRDSDEENDFLSSVTLGLCALNFSRLDSVDSLRQFLG